MPSLIKMGRKDSDYFLNLQEEIEKSTFSNQLFGSVGEYGYLCVSNSLYLILICKLISKPPCEVSACFFRPLLKNLTKSFGGVEKRIYICTRRILKLYFNI